MKFSNSANSAQRSSTAQETEINYFLDDSVNEIRIRISSRFSSAVVLTRKHGKTIGQYKAIGEISLSENKGLDLALIEKCSLSYDDILYSLPIDQLPLAFNFGALLNANHATAQTAIGIPDSLGISSEMFKTVCSKFSNQDLLKISKALRSLSVGSSWIPKIQSYLDTFESTESTESTGSTESTESTGSTGSTESTESTESTGSIGSLAFNSRQ